MNEPARYWCVPASAPKARTRICGMAVPDPGGMDVDTMLLTAWQEAVFRGEQRTAADIAARIAWHVKGHGHDDLVNPWRNQCRKHCRGVH